MRDIPKLQGTVGPVDETAAEFLRAQEVKAPVSVDELRQASESASVAVEQLFGNFDRLQAMKEEFDEENESPTSESYDAWVDAMLDLESAFLDDGDGALGMQLIELIGLDDAAFELRKGDARRLLQQTNTIAHRMYPSIHRLVTLGFGASRLEVIEKLSVGDLVKQERVHDVSVTPRRRTIIGLLRDLDARLPEDERTNAWTLEAPPELPPSIIVSDPFQVGDDALAAYWRHRIGTAHEVYEKKATILSLSGDKTSAVIWELENVANHATDEVLRDAARQIVQWLEGKQIYYQDPDPRDFELYHLGMEDPETLMHILRSLDVIKHFDPELFIELLGIDPSLGGRSPYFGSFLHKALYNTQRTIDHTSPELGTMAIQTMMKQLLTVDDRVQTYSAVVSQESLKAMAGEMKRSVDASPSSQSKAQTLMMMAVPFSRMAIDAEVRRQLDALREASPENVVEELRRRIADIEHPLKLADYLIALPKRATDDLAVRRELRKILSEEQIGEGVFRKIVTFEHLDQGVMHYKFDLPSILPDLYNRIPLIDESREDLGFALRIKVAIRDAVTLADETEEITTKSTSEKTKARQFLKGIMPVRLYREDYEAIKDQLGFWERRVADRFNYSKRDYIADPADNFRLSHLVYGNDEVMKITNEDRAFFIGQTIVEWELSKTRPQGYTQQFFDHIQQHRPDLVFLSIIAHPKGKEIAFKYFDKFCEMIPAERMCEILVKGAIKPIVAFRKLFERPGTTSTSPYIKYLINKIGRSVLPDDIIRVTLQPEDVQTLVKINRVLVEGKTPWEIQTGYRSSPPQELRIDLFDIYESLVQAYIQSGRFDEVAIRTRLANPDIHPPTEEQMRGMRACYTGPETSHGSDSLHIERLEKMICSYFYHGKDVPDFGFDLAPRVIRDKILR